MLSNGIIRHQKNPMAPMACSLSKVISPFQPCKIEFWQILIKKEKKGTLHKVQFIGYFVILKLIELVLMQISKYKIPIIDANVATCRF